MKRIWVLRPTESIIEISGNEHLHLSVVSRAKTGEEIIVISGDRYDRRYIIENIGKKKTTLKFLKKTENQCNPTKEFTVYLSLIKPDMLAFAVQKLNEIGAAELKLFTSQFSSVPKVNLQRLNEIAIQSCKQCGRSLPIKVTCIGSFENMISNLPKKESVAFLDNLSAETNLPQTFNSVIVGCEGGFTEKEREELLKNAIPVSFGNRILRAETAAIVGAAKWCI